MAETIRFRRGQQVLWVALSVVLGSGFVAGLYWFGLQQHYPFLPGSGSAKLWWDNGMGFIHSGRWSVERHGVRDLGEPAAWTIIGALLLLKAKDHPRILPVWLLAIWTAVLTVATVTAALGITYAINFTAFAKVSDPFSWKQLAAGIALGFLLKRAWSPVTGTIRYHVISKTYGTPLWVRFPLLSPAWRQEWLDTHQSEGTRAGWPGPRVTGWRAAVPVALVTFGVLAFLFIAVVGNIAKYVVARGISVPGMTSG